ncbi:hypothetical protein SCATT_55020 [Streptantibioticus cattleyicolor NRRL 8057 = DSM 46488]|uniref:Uncharacterized protein n=1 Tax=Streptantibioticus cattleyicolor (strain ATCC 35852 / DSM 46488 / JCM 4925 / NBRC 14057 / NRRL 8057) TaxID=1003195 RepID=G8WYA3_STREN|nr:hypothetical protein SCATT_55020 [Streptantibioticus cattleyicolor NRRL 8057 = DSM 46488]
MRTWLFSLSAGGEKVGAAGPVVRSAAAPVKYNVHGKRCNGRCT